ncbi:MAG: transporter substrate-binding domain-containing protein [Pseudomonadota bacterium]
MIFRLMISWLMIAAAATAAGVSAFAQDPDSAAQAQTRDSPLNRVLIRFVTTDDFPPFNARDEDGVLVGFNVDLARALCLELDVTCEVTARPWNTLFGSLGRDADAVIAAHRLNIETLAKADFTNPYFRTPGRFAGRRDGPKLTISPRGLDRRTIAVAKGTAHEAFIQTFFRTSQIRRFDTPEAARAALREKKVDVIFGDGIGLVFWINGSLSAGCCDLLGGAYLEPMFFGDGLAIAVAKGDARLRADLNRALLALRGNGRMLELLQRYFPRQIY